MWQRISRSSSCRSTTQHSQINDSSLRRKQLLNKIHSSNYAPSSENEARSTRATSSIYCIVNRPLRSLPLAAIVQGRSASQPSLSSVFPSNPVSDDSEPPQIGPAAPTQPLNISTHTDESHYASSNPTSSELTTSSPSPCALLKISDKVVSRVLVSHLARSEVSNPPARDFSCHASPLPQFRSVHILRSCIKEEVVQSSVSYWESDNWRRILDKIHSTGTNDDALRHLQNSEYLASIRNNQENAPFTAATTSPSAEFTGETIANLQDVRECTENVATELDPFTKTHMSALTTTASSVDFDYDERWHIQPRKPNFHDYASIARKFDQTCVCSETELARLPRQPVPLEIARHVETLNAKLKKIIGSRDTTVSDNEQRHVDKKKTDGKSARDDGGFVGAISASTHASVVGWMGKVIESMRWPLSTYFTAIHAMDYTLWKDYAVQKAQRGTAQPEKQKTREILPESLFSSVPKRSVSHVEFAVPLLSTACVLIGVSGECEHRQLSKARCFVGQVPNVTNVRDIICKELSVVAGLSHGSLIHKTAPDFCLYYISRFECFDRQLSDVEGRCGSLYNLLCQSFFIFEDGDQGTAAKEISAPQKSSSGSCRKKAYSSLEPSPSLLSYLLTPRYSHEPGAESLLPSESNVLSVLIEVALVISAALTMNSMHSHIPTSRIIATVMFHICTLVAPGLACGRACSEFCKVAFLLDYDRDLKVLIPTLFLAYEYCIEAFKEPSATARHIGFNKCTKSAFLLLKALLAGKESHKFPRSQLF